MTLLAAKMNTSQLLTFIKSEWTNIYISPSFDRTWRFIQRRIPPCAEDTAVGLQLLQKTVIGLDDGPPIPNVRKRLIQRPVLLLHGVGDHRGCRTRHSHLTVHQHRLPALPVTHRGGTINQEAESAAETEA